MIDDKQEPSAFPNGNLFPGNRGLTMRDWFAANAPEIQEGFIRLKWQEPDIIEHAPDENGNTKRVLTKYMMESAAEWRARWAYHFADAMMAQREK